MITPDAKSLARAGRRIRVPFTLPLKGDRGAVRCQSVLRVIPGKRAVLEAEWEGERVLAKLFYADSGRRRHLRRELEGYAALSRHRIPTSPLLYDGETGGHIGLLLFAYLEGAQSLEAVLAQGPDAPGVDGALKAALALLGRLHRAGLVQEDLHLGNFLVREGQVLAADCAAVTDCGRPLGAARALEDLARFLAQLPLAFMGRVPGLLGAYGSVSGDKELDPGALEARVARHREVRLRKFLRKIYRDSTRIASRRNLRWRALWDRELFSEEAAALLARTGPGTIPEGAEIVKAGRTTTVYRMVVEGRTVVVKRYNIKGSWHGVRRAFRRTRASHSWRNAHRLEMLGIPTPRPVAVVERRFGPLRGTAYFVSEHAEGPNALVFFSGEERADRESVARSLVELLHSLAVCRITHGDTKATNFIVTDSGPVVVDLDAMRKRHSMRRFEKFHRRDMLRFMANWEEMPGVEALFRETLEASGPGEVREGSGCHFLTRKS
ncbi:MAG: hypothetical protein JRJ35_08735 [Deltaproteobacteria bacterium]|nr:hypothetical protein [Deltaproteobacteria bacterium]MBW2008549.1 hypothetical protein [Deltaproteobacteria bacterium]